MKTRRRARLLLLATPAVAGACNLLIDAPERELEADQAETPAEDAATSERDARDAAPPEETDAGPDAPELVTIVVGTDWSSPNAATWKVDGEHTTITAFDGGANHPVIVPKVQPPVGAEDYTVFAVVRAPIDGEFGVLTRVQPDGSVVVVGSKYGTQSRPFIGQMGPPQWNPDSAELGPAYAFVDGATYHFRIRATKAEVAAKMWRASEPEPDYQVAAIVPWSTGRGVGFYTYKLPGAVLEHMEITYRRPR